MMHRLLASLIAAAALSACSQFPELDDSLGAEARSARYPDLVPVETLRAGLSEPRITDQTTASLEARVTNLRARAARLRGTVLDSASRARLSQPVEIAETN